MNNYYDVIVVGGGPSGSMAAWEVAKEGLSVCVLEKDRDIGSPVRCGEAIADIGLSQFIAPKPNWIAAKITSVKMVAPSNTDVETDFHKETGYILHRRIFDYDLSRTASEAGAEIYTKSYVSNIIKEDGFVTGVEVERFGEKKVISSKIVIGADGVASRVGRWAGIKTLVKARDMESCVQYSVSNIDVNLRCSIAPNIDCFFIHCEPLIDASILYLISVSVGIIPSKLPLMFLLVSLPDFVPFQTNVLFSIS